MEVLAPARKSSQLPFDGLLSMVGGFGRYTFLLYAFMSAVSIPIGLQQLVQVFYGATPKNFTCVSLSSSQINESCQVRKCCSDCVKYDFSGHLTSAVTEVSQLDSHLNSKWCEAK